MTPNITDIVEYKGKTWRVSSYLKLDKIQRDNDFAYNIDKRRVYWCCKEEAEYLSLSGVCGAIAPINECKFVRSLTGIWSNKQIADYIDSAKRNHGDYIF